MPVIGTISNITPKGGKMAWPAKASYVDGAVPGRMRSRITREGSHDITSGSSVRVTNPAALPSATNRRGRSVGSGVGDRRY
jgi:hypothetical protein